MISDTQKVVFFRLRPRRADSLPMHVPRTLSESCDCPDPAAYSPLADSHKLNREKTRIHEFEQQQCNVVSKPDPEFTLCQV